MRISVNGEVKIEGSGSEVMGHPLNSLLWIANERARKGFPLRPGDIITTGTCTGILAKVSSPAVVVADFGEEFGSVSVAIS